MAQELALDDLPWSSNSLERLAQLRKAAGWIGWASDIAVEEARRDGATWSQIEQASGCRIPTWQRRVMEGE